MRALLITIGVITAVLIVLGLVIKAVEWLLILGLIALVVAAVMESSKPARLPASCKAP